MTGNTATKLKQKENFIMAKEFVETTELEEVEVEDVESTETETTDDLVPVEYESDDDYGGYDDEDSKGKAILGITIGGLAAYGAYKLGKTAVKGAKNIIGKVKEKHAAKQQLKEIAAEMNEKLAKKEEEETKE